jgi:hypothetical protein
MNTAIEPKQRIYKSIHSGWCGETYITIGQDTYYINSYKRNGGALICRYHKGQTTNGSFSYELFGGINGELARTTGLCTEKNITALHKLGVEAFLKLKEAEIAKPKPGVAIGQVLFTYGMSKEQRRAVYEIVGQGSFKTVLLDGTDLHHDSHVKPYTEKFGIGVYYHEGDTITEDEVSNLVIDAHKAVTIRNQERDEQAALAKAERLRKIEAGHKLVTIPANATHILIGEHKFNDCDIQTDYFSYPTDKVLYLAYSTHKKDLFSEMRTAAANAEETKHLVTADKDMEHREKYSMGRGYYLGPYGAGWSVSKSNLTGYTDNIVPESMKELLYIAASEGRYFCEVTPAAVETTQQVPSIETNGDVQLYSYSDKAFAVTGEGTRAISQQLKALGGSFNRALKQPGTEKRIAGWIFSKKKEAAVKAALNL